MDDKEKEDSINDDTGDREEKDNGDDCGDINNDNDKIDGVEGNGA